MMSDIKSRDEEFRNAKFGDVIIRGVTRFRVNEVVDGHVWGTVIE